MSVGNIVVYAAVIVLVILLIIVTISTFIQIEEKDLPSYQKAQDFLHVAILFIIVVLVARIIYLQYP